jgi:ketosteroid isomerase-like protein
MRRIVFAVGFFVLAFGVAILAKTQTESVEQELIKLENGWADALVKRDVAFLDQILADDFMTTSSAGIVSTKAQIIASMESGEYVFFSAVLDDIKVRIYGDVAVVTGRNTVKSMRKGKDISGQERWTDTWIKREGRWHCVATHNSMIAQK